MQLEKMGAVGVEEVLLSVLREPTARTDPAIRSGPWLCLLSTWRCSVVCL